MKTIGNRLPVCFGIAILGAALCLVPGDAASAVGPQHATPHWDYEEHPPAKWGAMSPDFVTCSEGHSQSPVDITSAVTSKAPSMKAGYLPAKLRIDHGIRTADVVHTGHSIQVNIPQGNSLTIGEDSYALKQFHFHGPSEHTVNGRHFPMEVHFVHVSADKRLAVIGVLIEEGKANKAFEPISSNLPDKQGVEKHLENVSVDVGKLMPPKRAA